jgi:hypothetical protein
MKPQMKATIPKIKPRGSGMRKRLRATAMKPKIIAYSGRVDTALLSFIRFTHFEQCFLFIIP